MDRTIRAKLKLEKETGMKKLISLLLIISMMMLAAGCANRGKTETDAKTDTESYTDLIFDTTFVHTIDVTMSEEDRADQLAHPTEKTKYKAEAVIDGEKVENIAFHTKGNSSLFFPAEAGKDKFSYGLNFRKYTDGQTFHGLDKLDLQNNFTDAALIKEYMSFWLFRRMGVDAPLASYVWLTVNGEDQGIYTALEDIGGSFHKRTASGAGTLYKPEPGDMDLNDEEMDRIMSGNSAAHDTVGGADLVYRGDDETSYPDIFENAETDEDAETHARIIAALKALSDRKDLDKYLETEEIIKYFAVHNYLVNFDSYTGAMLHNYCLREKDGRLAMLPWDYDTACGTFPADATIGSAVDSTIVINTGIDSPLGGAADEARPMWNWILTDENYLKEYHDNLSEVTDIIESGEFEEEAGRVYDLIFPYIEKDPKAYFTPDRSKKARETLIKFSELRAESVRRQLSGLLAAKTELQNEEDRVDASGITITDMGTIEDLK